jgi:hypothetical protein
LYFRYGRKFNYLYTCTVKPYDAMTVKSAVVMSVTACRSSSLVVLFRYSCSSNMYGVGVIILHTCMRYSANSHIGSEFQVRVRTD